MTSEVEERPRLVTGGYGPHRSQWVKGCKGFAVMPFCVIFGAVLRKSFCKCKEKNVNLFYSGHALSCTAFS